MNEVEWQASNEPLALISHLRGPPLRMSRWFPWMTGPTIALPVEKVRALFKAFEQIDGSPRDVSVLARQADLPLQAVSGILRAAVGETTLAQAVSEPILLAHLAEVGHHPGMANAVRCIFGNPFRTGSFDPRWQSSSVQDLVKSMEIEQSFELLPILADALEEAGCGESDILAHCRQNEPYYSGCWVLNGLTIG